MTEPFERLREARARAGYKGPADVCRRFGWNLETYTKHENGGRGIRKRAAARYARAFRVDPGWILYGGHELAAAAAIDGAPESPQWDQATLARAIAVARRLSAACDREGDQELEALILSAAYALLLGEKTGFAISDDDATLAIIEKVLRRIAVHTRKR